jgi:sigma-B regulation protein RsbU (phosphoserine phosphatase)
MNNRRLAYILLGILFVFSAAYEIGFAYRVIHVLRSGPEMASEPLDFGFNMRKITGMSPEARAAGINWGDYLEEIDGRPFTGLGLVHEAVAARRPGDLLPVVVRREDGSLLHANIKLARKRGQATAADWMLRLCLRILLPLLCLTLGFWVVIIRPLDRLAWLLLGLMESFAANTWNFAWDGPATPPRLHGR